MSTTVPPNGLPHDDVPIDSILEGLVDAVSGALERERSTFGITDVGEEKGIADETRKLAVTAPSGERIAFILCSSPASPDIVQRGVNGARKAAAALPARLKDRPLTPLADGRVHGLSYAIMPFVHPIASSGPRWYLQRQLLRKPVLHFLRDVAKSTAKTASGSGLEPSFHVPLEHLAQLGAMPERVRVRASEALSRLAKGSWQPVHVLMHGDLWAGNILIDPRKSDQAWAHRFVITDWPGARVNGYGVFDLVRICDSLRCPRAQLTRELLLHAEILGCEPQDLPSHLLCALGDLGLQLEHFPLDRFVEMADRCLQNCFEALG